MTQKFPLTWPVGQKRTPSWLRGTARFDTTQDRAQACLMQEIQRLGGRDIILSTNIKIRRDGLPYARQQRLADDPGVAVYFTYKNRPMCFACDKWSHIKDNMQAVRKTIEALRGIELWGSSDMMESAFRGFEALPNPEQHWSVVLDVPTNATIEQIEIAYRAMSKVYHPDKLGGSEEMMAKLNAARDKARKERAGTKDFGED